MKKNWYLLRGQSWEQEREREREMPLFHIKMFFYVRKNSNKENGENIKKMEKILKFKKNDLSWIIIMLNSLKQKVFFFL